MREADRIVQQMDRSFRGEAWSGPSLLDALAGVDAESAFARPVPGAHTVWELVLHLCGTYQLVLRRTRGEPIDLTPEEDWPAPPDEPSQQEWEGALARLESWHRELIEAAGALEEADLQQMPAPRNRFTVYDQLHGLAQHNLYHAGQILLLRKASVAEGQPSQHGVEAPG
jgi:uncharacterized damage-inducible protein DinB